MNTHTFQIVPPDKIPNSLVGRMWYWIWWRMVALQVGSLFLILFLLPVGTLSSSEGGQLFWFVWGGLVLLALVALFEIGWRVFSKRFGRYQLSVRDAQDRPVNQSSKCRIVGMRILWGIYWRYMLLIALVAIPVLLLSILSPSVSSALRLVMLLASGFFLVWLARATRAALSKSYNGYRVVVVEILTNVPKRQSELPPTPEQIGRQSVLKALKGK